MTYHRHDGGPMNEDQPEQMSPRTENPADILRTRFQELVPGAIQDGVLDVKRLSELLGVPTAGNPDTKERFGLMWAGRGNAVKALQEPSLAALVPDMENSIGWDTAKNVFIEGDNLEVLKLLQKAYNDQVDLIYIDPPYNTGNDFVYNDDFSDTVQRYLEVSGQVDGEGNRLVANSDVSGRKHSNWISMMYPRLMLARNLLKQDGFIVVSIDDNEVATLKLLMDEVFGSENEVAQFVWHYEGVNDNAGFVKRTHEYVMVYGRTNKPNLSKELRDPNIDLPNVIENSVVKNGPKNPASSVTLPPGFPCDLENGTLRREDVRALHADQDFVIRDFRLVREVTVTSGWSSREILEKFIQNRFEPVEDAKGQRTEFSVTSTGNIVYRKVRDQSHVLSVLRNLGTVMNAGADLKKMGIYFDYPKPVGLIQYLIGLSGNKDGLIVDFFAGSGTTGHAVALQNDRDGGRRRYLLVNVPESTDPKSVARRAGFQTVSSMTRRRLMNVCNDSEVAKEQGLRCFVLGRSSFVDTTPKMTDDMPLLVEGTLRPDATNEEIAAEALLKSGVRLDEEWVTAKYASSPVTRSGSVSVVLDRTASDAVVEAAVSDSASQTVVFLEDSFAEADGVKANAYFAFRNANKTMKTM